MQHPFEITVADREHQIPAHGPQDHLGRELPTLKLFALPHDTRAVIRLVETARLPNPDPPHKLATDPWEMVFQPKYAAYLNLIEPWWKVLRSLTLAGRRFETWDEVTTAIAQATDYWNAHRHPFIWGQRRRHRPRRQPGIALLPKAA